MRAKLIIENDNEVLEYDLPIGDSMMLAIELDAAFHENDILDSEETLDILDSVQAKILDY